MEELKKEPVTSFLLFLNLIVFVVIEFTGGSQNTMHMYDFGACYAPKVVNEQEYYRLFTSMFMHFGMTHLANNMLVLFVLGGRLERSIGKVKYLCIYLLGGLIGNIASVWMEMKKTEYPVSAGASGAIFAVLGALVYLIIRNKGHLEDLSARQILIMAALSLYFGFSSSGVDNVAHVGGLLGGVLLAAFLYHPKRIQKELP